MNSWPTAPGTALLKPPLESTFPTLVVREVCWNWEPTRVYFADIPSPSLLIHLLKVEGVQQNVSLVNGYS